MPIFADQSREQLRQMYLASWRKFRAHEPLSPLEGQIAAVIAEHPEYIAWLESGREVIGADFTPEGGRQNPFLHMGMHLAIREQLSTNRPTGFAALYRRLCEHFGNAHEAEHVLLTPLGEALWEAQRAGRAPDEMQYLRKVEALVARITAS
ncbi:MAG TPA: DUF1841 family protein [Steroidobacteraceae bacterium]